jgi:N-acetyl-gamma-glutamyl-phosphate reductase
VGEGEHVRARVGIVGARGYVGQELLQILVRHPRVEVAFVSSRTQAGEPALGGRGDLRFEDLSAEEIAGREADAVVLALPNEHSRPVVAAVERLRPDTVLLDLSADHRFDDGWCYGLPELYRARLGGARRIANPGCYATAAALAVRPVASRLAAPAEAFGVSGYSGAGTTPSPRNDVERLQGNIMPYSLIGHAHEREVTRHAGPVHLMPHVAPFFRGLTVTMAMSFTRPISREALRDLYVAAYAGEPLVRVEDEIPLPRSVAGKPHAVLGGLCTDAAGARGVVVAALDNLLKGAASQAVQNLNLALGVPEREGLEPWPL